MTRHPPVVCVSLHARFGQHRATSKDPLPSPGTEATAVHSPLGATTRQIFYNLTKKYAGNTIMLHFTMTEIIVSLPLRISVDFDIEAVVEVEPSLHLCGQRPLHEYGPCTIDGMYQWPSGSIPTPVDFC